MLSWLWGERGPGKMWPWGGGSEILTENVASGGSRGMGLGGAGGCRGVVVGVVGAQKTFKAKKLSPQKRLQKNGYGNRNQFCVEASLQHSKNDVSPTRNHCFHKCNQAFENHEIGLKG